MLEKTKELSEKECNKQKNTKILIGAFIFISFIFGWAFGHMDFQTQGVSSTNITGKASVTNNVDFSLFWQVWDRLAKNFDGKIDTQKMVYGAIDGLVKSLGDPYTVFMNPEDAKSFSQELEGSINGIGAEVGIKDNRVIIIAPLDSSPAAKAGIMANDVIMTIDGVDTTGMDLNTAVSKIRGNVGTKVKLEIQRGETKQTYEITRAKVDTKSVRWEIKDNNIGYIQITRFDSNTSTQIKSATTELSGKGVKAIVLDLRNNPGGYLDSAVVVASEFVKSGIVVSEKTTEKTSTEQKYFASGKGTLTDTAIPMVVLTNGGSASASEIVAGAIKDNGRGILLGEKTFGKGSVQTVDTLSGGASIRITIAHWFTPNGKNISKEGISPDIEVKLTEEEAKADRDPQLDKAISHLKDKIK
jgi:carboxyl-terminal processing protease